MTRNRTLKIHAKHRQRSYDSTKVPEIRLEGKWLESLGFEIGGEVNLDLREGEIRIRCKGAL
ncbi:SymE family type I addiction module toxin [Croceimicrobium hydrocarbonivorans]|uniref:Type I addiction module toxin, SymE family n=1 Tax=Croceimicrobium hydrocarbonivorans TaxID=2761580 RepID=A0A7H0VE23_9FLAO|nr:type I addiction module toxin, SymE family [Croceimicrobium hydrocarbonivorans]